MRRLFFGAFLLLTTQFVGTAFPGPKPKIVKPARTVQELYEGTDERPDYLWRFYEIARTRNGGDRELTDLIERYGVMELPNEKLYQLESRVKEALTPVLQKNFPGEFEDYDVLFLASNDFHTGLRVYGGKKTKDGRNRPVLVLDSAVWRLFENEDGLKFVGFHEAGHKLRINRIRENWLERVLNGMEVEHRVDAIALRLMPEAGANPQAGYSLLGRLAETIRKRRTQQNDRILDGLGSHPPDSVRVSRASTVVDELSQRLDFPETTPLLPLDIEAKESPANPLRWQIAILRSRMASNLDVGRQFANLGLFISGADEYTTSASGFYDYQMLQDFGRRDGHQVRILDDRGGVRKAWERIRAEHGDREFSGKRERLLSRRMVLDLLNTEVTTLVGRLTPRSLSQISSAIRFEGEYAPKSWEGVAHRYHELWAWVPNEWKADPDFIDFFKKKEKEFEQRAQKWGGTFRSYDSRILAELAAEKRLESMADIQEWQKHYALSRRLIGSETRLGKKSPEFIFQRTVLTPSLVQDPKLFYEAFEHYLEIAPAIAKELTQLNSIEQRKAIEAFRDYRDSLYSLLIAMAYHPDENELLRLKEKIETWNRQIQGLAISAEMKFILFPPAIFFDRSPQHLRDWEFKWEKPNDHDPGKLVGSTLFRSSTEIFDQKRSPDGFRKFHKQLERIAAINGDTDLQGIQYEPHKFSYRINPQSQIINIKGVGDWLFDSLSNFDLTLEDVKTIANSKIYWHTPEALHEYTTTRTLYDKQEYRVPVKEAARLQQLLFSVLKKKGQIPKSLDEEVLLWRAFVSRGVTDFTDEWAESIVARAMKSPEANKKLLKDLFESRLIWDLNVRSSLARHIFSNGFTRASQQLRESPAGTERRRQIATFLREVKKYFPEKSEERIQVVDFMANQIQSNSVETETMMAAISEVKKDDSLDEITRDQAIGQRFFAQLISEVRSAELKEQLEFLDFMLGKTDTVPGIFSESTAMRSEETSKSALDVVGKYFGAHRLRRMFQSLSVQGRTALIDPLFTLSDGIPQQAEGRRWLIQTLVPGEPSWKQMGVDLVDGYIEGLQKLGRGHQETLFLSYLIASSSRSKSGQYNGLFEWPGSDESAKLTMEGRILKAIFQANSALMKIGQQLHSSHILPEEHNQGLHSLKEESQNITRHQYFGWMEAAANCEGICEKVELGEMKGNASVKGVASAKIEGQKLILHLVRPNAARMGNADFDLVKYAVNYARAKGHWQLGLIAPMVERGQATFLREINMNHERESAAKLSGLYTAAKAYGDGVHFITPEQISLSADLFKPERVAAVAEISVKRLSALPKDEMRILAEGISEKENEILAAEGIEDAALMRFEKDRHEGNYLLVVDEALLSKLGLSGKRVLLVIDPAQISEISGKLQQATLEGLAQVGAFKHGLIERDVFLRDLSTLIEAELVDKTKANSASKSQIQTSIEDALSHTQEKGVGESYSAILAFVESGGKSASRKESAVQLRGEVWDYVKALQTNQTWDQYTSNGFTPRFVETMAPRVMRKSPLLAGLFGCVPALRALAGDDKSAAP